RRSAIRDRSAGSGSAAPTPDCPPPLPPADPPGWVPGDKRPSRGCGLPQSARLAGYLDVRVDKLRLSRPPALPRRLDTAALPPVRRGRTDTTPAGKTGPG